MDTYPAHIYAALASMGPVQEEDIQAYLTEFTLAWGSYEAPSLRRALHKGGEFDRLFAVWALGATHTVEAREAILPLLESVQPLEHWASALALGEEYHDTRALPTLRRMLSEMLPPYTDTHRITSGNGEFPAADYYFLWRYGIPTLLGKWGGTANVPALRTGLQVALRVELALADPEQQDSDDDGIVGGLHDWMAYEDRVVYALGRLGGFGALAGIEGAQIPLRRSSGTIGARLSQSHLDQWRIQLIMGSLHGQYTLKQGGLWRWEQTPELLQAVTHQLEQVFGLEPEIYTPALERYAVEMGFTLAETYGWRDTDTPNS